MVGEEKLQVTGCRLQVFPNPCSGGARLRYQINDKGYQLLDLYSISGLRIKRLLNEEKPAGVYEVEIDLSDLPAGVYFIRMQSGDQVATGKIVLMR